MIPKASVAQSDKPEETTALDAALQAWAKAYNSHDAEALANEYTEDADLMPPSGERLKGRAAIKKRYVEEFSKHPAIKTRLSDVSRRFLTPEIVVEDGAWEESGGSEGTTKGRYVAILVKRDGKWIAIHERGWATEQRQQGK
jgi:uncharacterized protein (TIGR02246 family)